MKNAMAVGIGLFIAFIGLQNAGIIVTASSITQTVEGPILSPGTLVKQNPTIVSIDLIVFAIGLLVTAVLHVRKIRGSILLGIVSATVLSIIIKLIIGDATGHAMESQLISGSKLATDFTLATGLFSMPHQQLPYAFAGELVP